MSNLIKNRYSLNTVLQEGRMGVTYLAKNLDDNSECIVKKVRLSTHDNTSKIKSLEEEAKVLSHLNHKNIPKLIEIFIEDSKDQYNNSITEIYLVQEYIEGRNLQEIIDKEKAFSEIEAVEIILKLCNICEYIHSFSPSLIHQDIKPANIIIGSDKSVNLIDFGAVKQKILNHENSGLSTIIGTQGYMSIEQFEGNPVPASDIYSMGLTLISLVSRKQPLLLEKKGLIFTFNDLKISERLKVILTKMTQPDWNKRYLNVKELKEDLEEFILNPNKKKINIFSSDENSRKFVKSQLADNEKLKIFIKSKKVFDWKSLVKIYIKYQILLLISGVFLFSKFVFISIGLIIFFIFLLRNDLKLIKKKDYVITDKRLMIIESEKGYKKVESYNLQNIILTDFDHNSSGRGNISLIGNNHEKISLEKIENVYMVNKIFQEIIKNNIHGK